MKKIVFLVMALSFQVASAFSVQGSCHVDGASASCEIYNQWAYPAYCIANAKGRTSYGFWANGVVQGWVYPGQSLNVYVYATNPWQDPLINATVSANCNF